VKRALDDRILAELGGGATEPARITARGGVVAAPGEPDFEGTERFEIVRRIGEGGMGVVYEAWDRSRSAPVALKTLRQLDADALLRFKNEFRLLSDISHENLVRLGELFEHAGRWFFTMELVEGEDFLGYVVDAGAPLGFDEGRLRSSLASLSRALDALHAAGSVHRDIKPSNVRVTPEGRVVLLDFGLVTETRGPRRSREGSVVGTAAYMAPEQARSQRVGPAADWYSLGVMLFEVLTGRLPFEGTPLDILLAKQGAEAPDPLALRPEIPPDLAALARRLLHADPARRRSIGSDDGGEAPFVGRGAELEALCAAFADVQQGSALTVYVHGESGMGKSALIRRFTDELVRTDPRVLVLSGRCYERESVPYKAFDGVVDALSHHLAELPDHEAQSMMPHDAGLLPATFPVLGRVGAIACAPSSLRDVTDAHELRSRVFSALRGLLSELAAARPVVVVIDDMQWSDSDSALLLTDLMRPPDPPRLLLLCCSRRQSRARVEDPLARRETRNPSELALPGELRDVALGPLSGLAARELAEALLERAGCRSDLAPAIAEEAQGLPLFIDELVRHAAAGGGERLAPIRLDEAILRRVSTLSPSARRVLDRAREPERRAADARGRAARRRRRCGGARQGAVRASRREPGEERAPPDGARRDVSQPDPRSRRAPARARRTAHAPREPRSSARGLRREDRAPGAAAAPPGSGRKRRTRVSLCPGRGAVRGASPRFRSRRRALPSRAPAGSRGSERALRSAGGSSRQRGPWGERG
jgi:hypothetical protein